MMLEYCKGQFCVLYYSFSIMIISCWITTRVSFVTCTIHFLTLWDYLVIPYRSTDESIKTFIWVSLMIWYPTIAQQLPQPIHHQFLLWQLIFRLKSLLLIIFWHQVTFMFGRMEGVVHVGYQLAATSQDTEGWNHHHPILILLCTNYNQ